MPAMGDRVGLIVGAIVGDIVLMRGERTRVRYLTKEKRNCIPSLTGILSEQLSDLLLGL